MTRRNLVGVRPPAIANTTGAAVVSRVPRTDGLRALYILKADQRTPPDPPRPVYTSLFQPLSVLHRGDRFNDRWYIVWPRNLGLSFRAAGPPDQRTMTNARMTSQPAFRKVLRYPRYPTTTPTYPSRGDS
jgi:hypothetical protein